MGMLSMSYWSSVVLPSSPSLSFYSNMLMVTPVHNCSVNSETHNFIIAMSKWQWTFNTILLTSMCGRLEEFHKSANTIEKECDRELKKSVNEAKEACTRTVKTSKYLAKKTKKDT
ncbi:uncharacterized protein [Dysidea avara]|uniref:uncharacterized protein isoform X3 n=1 Tax=Dysidea avara TaxID=196820 RepID=UPI00332887F7